MIWLIGFYVINEKFIRIESRKSSDEDLKSFEIDENLLRKRCELICYKENRENHENKVKYF